MSATRLSEQLPQAEFNIAVRQVEGPYAFLVWSARSDRFDVVEGADSFVIEGGKIVFQSIHYGLTKDQNDLAGAVTKGVPLWRIRPRTGMCTLKLYSANCCPWTQGMSFQRRRRYQISLRRLRAVFNAFN